MCRRPPARGRSPRLLQGVPPTQVPGQGRPVRPPLRLCRNSAPVDVNQPLVRRASLYVIQVTGPAEAEWGRPGALPWLAGTTPHAASSHPFQVQSHPSRLLLRGSRRRQRRFRRHLRCCADEETASRSHWTTFSTRQLGKKGNKTDFPPLFKCAFAGQERSVHLFGQRQRQCVELTGELITCKA